MTNNLGCFVCDPQNRIFPSFGSSFRAVEATWDRALGEAHEHIDAMLGEHASLQEVGSRHEPPTGKKSPPRCVPPQLELIFNSVWEVIRPQGHG